MAPEKGRKPQAEDDLLDWFTITYRSIYVAVGVLVDRDLVRSADAPGATPRI
jgi:hypothetical protein